MSDHRIRWEYSHWSVSGTLLCAAPEDADCHLRQTCECEEYGEILTDEDGRKYHVTYSWASMVDRGEVETRHYMTSKTSHCNIAEWLNSADLLDEGNESFVIAETPVETWWADRNYQWKRVES